MAILAAAAAFATPPADTTRFTVEVRGGAAIGHVAASHGNPDRVPGPAFRIAAAMAVTRFADLTAGYGSSGFGCRTGFCEGNTVRFTGAGFDAGARVHAGHVWAHAGVVRHVLRSRWRAQGGTGRAATEAALGWHAGAGVAVPVADRVQLTPGVRYIAYRAAHTGGPADAVGYLTGDVGVRVAFR